MFLLYVDASGTASASDVGTRHCVLLGLAVHEGTWFALDKRLNGLKNGYGQAEDEFELHASEFPCTIKEQDEIPGFAAMSWTERRATITAIRQAKINAEHIAKARLARAKRYKRTASFIHLTRQERSHLLEDALDLVGEHKGIILFGEAIAKAHPGISAGQIDPVRQAFEQIVARFDAFLKRRDEWKQKKSPRRIIDNGLLVLDQDYSTETAIISQFKDFRRQGHPWGKLLHVIDVPFFAASDRVSGLQLVDICAYALRRYLDKNAAIGSYEEKNFQRIFQRFDREEPWKTPWPTALHTRRNLWLFGLPSARSCCHTLIRSRQQGVVSDGLRKCERHRALMQLLKERTESRLARQTSIRENITRFWRLQLPHAGGVAEG